MSRQIFRDILVTYYKQLNPEDTRTIKLFSVMNSVKYCLDIFWSLTFTYEERVEQQEAGHDVWILLWKDQCCCLQLIHTASASSPKALESPRVSKLTSSSSTCTAPLLHPEIFVFFRFHVRQVFVSSTRPLALCESSGHSPALFCHGLTQKL